MNFLPFEFSVVMKKKMITRSIRQQHEQVLSMTSKDLKPRSTSGSEWAELFPLITANYEGVQIQWKLERWNSGIVEWWAGLAY